MFYDPFSLDFTIVVLAGDGEVGLERVVNLINI